MSTPVNGTPPGQPAPQNPRALPPGFTSFPMLAACLIMDRAHAELNMTVSQLAFLGQLELAGAYQSVAQQLIQMRNEFYRQQQGGIILAGAGDLPPPRA